MLPSTLLVQKRLNAFEKAFNKAKSKTNNYLTLYQDFVKRKNQAFEYMGILRNNVNGGAYDKILLAIDGWDAMKTAARMALLEGEIKRLRKGNADLLHYNREARKVPQMRADYLSEPVHYLSFTYYPLICCHISIIHLLKCLKQSPQSSYWTHPTSTSPSPSPASSHVQYPVRLS